MTESPYAHPHDSTASAPPYGYPHDGTASAPPYGQTANWGYAQPPGGYPPQQGYPAGGGYPGPGQQMYPGGPPPQRSNRNTLVVILGAAGVLAILLMAGLITVVTVVRSDDDRPGTVAEDPAGATTPPATPGATPTASAAPPAGGGGKYQAPQELCDKLDFAPLTAVFGATQGTPSTSRSQYDTITVSCGVVMRQGSKSAISTVSGYFVGSDSDARRDYEYQVTSAKNTFAAKNGIREIPGAGEKAFGFRWDSSSETTATFQLWILDGNLTFSAKVLGSAGSGSTWTKADEDKVFTALTTLGTAALTKLKG
ncbi:hypothetical protein GCM10009557_81950 [Virgisporangium ochraceum]|uniref:DUF3558 domain-containing protein n=1 Tax=Virgisporangium ochraceum TaxID=65505 RepID=A0A8J4EHS7_9ACTN|nr:hypothetical protein [Virgisporangium ochraceum]GIJ72507.1 hypothetical protein Voc01_074240 [Virgisporangium ochraceum]